MANVPVEIRVREGRIVHSNRWHQVTHVLPGDTVSWTCNGAAFKVSGIKHDCGDGCKSHPPHPFREPISERVFARGELNVSLRVVAEASGGKYKGTWAIYEDENSTKPLHVLDPHIYVGP